MKVEYTGARCKIIISKDVKVFRTTCWGGNVASSKALEEMMSG